METGNDTLGKAISRNSDALRSALFGTVEAPVEKADPTRPHVTSNGGHGTTPTKGMADPMRETALVFFGPSYKAP